VNRTLDDARASAREAIDEAYLLADPERALWPATASRHQTDAHAAAASAHKEAVVLKKYLPPMHQEGERWDEELAKYEFPDGTTLPVSLATVDRWRDIKYTDDGPAVQRVLLPVSAAREIVRQVDAIARNAGLVDPATAEGDRAKYR